MILTVESAGQRLDKFLAERCTGLSRSQIQKLIERRLVAVNRRSARSGYKLAAGDLVEVTLPPPLPALAPEAVPLSVVYEDKDILVVDKPAGMVVHPAAGRREHTMVNALLARCPELAVGAVSTDRPGIVHRLDKDTSGLIVVARTETARESLVAQFRAHSLAKKYVALAVGHVTPDRGVIDAPIGRDPAHRKRMAVVEGGREARTGYRVLEYRNGYTLLELTPETGRTHQIRVHLAAIGHPVAGDRVYGGRSPRVPRQFLHASALGFQHPTTGEALAFSSPLPEDLRAVLDRLPPTPAGFVLK
ncbi:MAG: RluA family pseudouridine synthase [Chloroflexi bacterium]|nr:RluA family pseudouridine synthase [Chloroflexota bacterium]